MIYFFHFFYSNSQGNDIDCEWRVFYCFRNKMKTNKQTHNETGNQMLTLASKLIYKRFFLQICVVLKSSIFLVEWFWNEGRHNNYDLPTEEKTPNVIKSDRYEKNWNFYCTAEILVSKSQFGHDHSINWIFSFDCSLACESILFCFATQSVCDCLKKSVFRWECTCTNNL